MADGEKVYYYLPAFDRRFDKYSVGSILLKHIILEAGAEGYQAFDFLRGDEKYKQLWGTNQTFNVDYNIFNKSAKSLLLQWIYKTYFSRKFNEKPLLLRMITKMAVRGAVFLLYLAEKI
jgi:hypothetical protein